MSSGILNVKLIAVKTAGTHACMEMNDDIPLGKVYRVNMAHGKLVMCRTCGREFKLVEDAERPEEYLPMELLVPFEP